MSILYICLYIYICTNLHFFFIYLLGADFGIMTNTRAILCHLPPGHLVSGGPADQEVLGALAILQILVSLDAAR